MFYYSLVALNLFNIIHIFFSFSFFLINLHSFIFQVIYGISPEGQKKVMKLFWVSTATAGEVRINDNLIRTDKPHRCGMEIEILVLISILFAFAIVRMVISDQKFVDNPARTTNQSFVISEKMNPLLNADLVPAKLLHYYISGETVQRPLISTYDFPDSIPKVEIRRDKYTQQPVQRGRVHLLQNGKKYKFAEFLEILQCPSSQPDLGYSGSLELSKLIPPSKEIIEMAMAFAESKSQWSYKSKTELLADVIKYKSGRYRPKFDVVCPPCGQTFYRVINNTLFYDWAWGVERTIPSKTHASRANLASLVFVLHWVDDFSDSSFFMGGQDPHFPWNFPFPNFNDAPSIETNHIAWPWPESIRSEVEVYRKIASKFPGSRLNRTTTDKEYKDAVDFVEWDNKEPRLAFHATYTEHRQIAFDIGRLRPDLFAMGMTCPNEVTSWHPLSNETVKGLPKLLDTPNSVEFSPEALHAYSKQFPGYATNFLPYCQIPSTGEEQKFKYILVPISCAGSSTSGRFARLLSQTGSVIFLQSSKNVYHFSARLKPWVHYVPVAYSLADLTEKVVWLREHDDMARQIAMNGKAFADSYLRYEEYSCYVASALHVVGEMMRGTTAIDPFHPIPVDITNLKKTFVYGVHEEKSNK